MRGPSAKAMVQHFIHSRGPTLDMRGARELKKLMTAARRHDEIDAVLDKADKMLGTHGVESIEGDYQVDRYYYNIVALYLNTGDSYGATLLYETEPERFVLTTMGDWVVKNERRYKIR